MKHLPSLGCFILLALIASAFVWQERDRTAKEVAYKFTSLLNQMNYGEAKKYSTPETQKMLDMLASFSGMMPDSIKENARLLSVKILDETEYGDKATVEVMNGNELSKINLQKTNGQWLVHLSKDDPGGGSAGELKQTK